ncbi:MAG: hypothetical protein ACOCW2_02935 [Chitinivibrionales bacterium]
MSAWPLDSVLSRADSCASVVWTPTQRNTDPWWFRQYGGRCSGSDTVYLRCDFVPGVQYTGVAYSYGGEDSDVIFKEKLATDFLVGSHSCHYYTYGDPSDTVAGADCSGFLSYVWNSPRYSTSGFLSSSRYEKIPVDEVRSGDALVKAQSGCGYHAVLVVERADYGETLIAEASSSVFGVRFRTTDLSHSYWDCYAGLRNPKIERDVFTATPEEKISLKPFSLKKSSSGTFHLTAQEKSTYTIYASNGPVIQKGTVRPDKAQKIILPSNTVYFCTLHSATVSKTFRLVHF